MESDECVASGPSSPPLLGLQLLAPTTPAGGAAPGLVASTNVRERIAALEAALAEQGKPVTPRPPALTEEQLETAQQLERVRARRMFDMLDTDHSGDLSSEEFQILAFRLGETLSLHEARAAVAALDTDRSGSVSFNEFFAWWKEAGASLPGGGGPGGSDASGHCPRAAAARAKMSVVKMKMLSKTYRSDLKLLAPRISESLLSLNSREFAPMAKIEADVRVGKVFQPAASATVTFHCDHTVSEKYRSMFGLSDRLAFAAALTVRDGVDDFQLGALAGSLKTILAAVSRPLALREYTVRPHRTDDGSVFLLLSVSLRGTRLVSDIVSSVKPKVLYAGVSFSERPSRTPQPRTPTFEIKFKAEFPRDTPAVLNELFGAGDRTDGCGGGGGDGDGGGGGGANNAADGLSEDLEKVMRSLPADLADRYASLLRSAGKPLAQVGPAPRWVVRTLEALIGFRLAAEVDDISSLRLERLGLPAFGTSRHSPRAKLKQLRGWKSVKELLRAPTAELLREEEVTKKVDALALYEDFIEILRGVDIALVQAGDFLLVAKFDNMDLVDLLPDIAEVLASAEEGANGAA